MEVHSVLSSFIKGVGYESGTLRVVFKNGKAWDYFNVSKEDYSVFMQNFGKAYNSTIVKKYKGEPVTDFFYD